MRSVFITIIFFSSIFIVAAQDADKLAIRELVSNQVTAWNARDLDGFMKDVQRKDSSKNFVGLTGWRTIYGWKATRDSIQKLYFNEEVTGRLSIDINRITISSSSLAFAFGRWKIDSDPKLKGNYVLLLSKISGNWIIRGINMTQKK